MIREWTRRRLLMGAASVAVMAASLSLPRRAMTQDRRKVRLGVLRLASSGPVFIAVDAGYFADAGLDVELTFFDAAQPIAVAAAAGDIDIGVTAITAGLLNLAGQGALTIVGGQSREVPGHPLNGYLVGKAAYEAGVTKPEDLAGHSIGITQVGSSFHYSMGLLARKYGFDLKGTRLVPLQSLSNIASALKGGSVDAALLPATSAQPLLDGGDAKLVGWVGDETPWQLGAVFIANAMKSQSETVGRFLDAYRQGTREYASIVDQADASGVAPVNEKTKPLLEMISHYINLPPEKVARGLAYVEPDGLLDIASVDDQIGFMREQTFVSGTFKAADIVDTSYGFAK